MNYIKYLADARLINILYPVGQEFPKKPPMVVMHNPNLMYAIYPIIADKQAVMENFFGLLKSELLYLQDFDSLEHFKAELVEYLDYYNNRRIKLKLKGLTPAQHRYQTLQAA